ncbi:MAG: phosphotriesterase family protein [Clostridia bacterium]
MPINGVLGPIADDELGMTLMHEHVMTSSAGIWQTYPEVMGDVAAIERVAVDTLTAARGAGIRTIVDLTTMDLGRQIRFEERVAREAGMQIVAATGVWLDVPRVMRFMQADAIAALFIRELTDGIEDTGIRAGVIKVASDMEGVTDPARTILVAAARAAAVAGVPIMTHSYSPGRVGEQQADVLEAAGADPSRVVIGHSNDTTDLDYLTGLLRRGFNLGLDRFPGRIGPDAAARTEVIQRLLDAGFGRQLILSHDHVIASASSGDDRARRQAYNPDGYLYISRHVVPRLRAPEPDTDLARLLLVDNPRRLFGGR